MKKYNTPEIMISMFNVEEVLTDSAYIVNAELAKGNRVVRINHNDLNFTEVQVEY